MIGDIYYLSGDRKNKIALDRHPYWMQSGSFLDYEWSYETKRNNIISFLKEVYDTDFLISIFGDTEEEFNTNYKHLHDVFEKDVVNMTPGFLYVGKYYLRCYVTASEKTDWIYDNGILDCNFTISTAYPFWIQEKGLQFLPRTGTTQEEGLDFTYDFSYDYTAQVAGNSNIYVDHFTGSDFEMIIYGACVDPKITINNHAYQVYTTLEANEYLKINSKDHTVMKYLANGTVQNVYDARAKEQSIFDKIPGQNVSIYWNGTFGFDVTMFLERSEPEWN